MGGFISVVGPIAHPEPLVTKVVTPDPVPVPYHCLNKSHLPLVCVLDLAGW